jgi:3-phosphoshikimate 1-carboxyvinyltransferase
MKPLVDCLDTLGANLRSADGYLPVEVEGRVLDGGTAEVRPEVSSQFVSALAMAAPLMNNGLELVVSGPLPSTPYLDLTVDVLCAFGGRVEVSDDRRRWTVAPLPLERRNYTVEGDWSAAAFALSAVAVAGGELDIGPLNPASRQGDRVAVRILADAGLDVDWREGRVVARGPITAPLTADLEDTPDLFPALVSVAACAPPGSRFFGLDHLKHKESDRLAVMVSNLQRLGAKMVLRGSELTVEDTVKSVSDAVRPATAAGDHRIAMALAVVALGAGPIELDDPSCVTKSFPRFWDQWKQMVGRSASEGRAH